VPQILAGDEGWRARHSYERFKNLLVLT
jgi:hypothetical protein